MRYITNRATGIILILFSLNSFAQDSKLLLDKPGKFKIVNWSVYGLGGSDFTKVEKDANFKKLCAIAEVVHQNPVMKDLKGFDCDATLYGRSYDKRNGYGIPCQLAFNFCSWSVRKNKEYKWTIEPPHWDIEVNRIVPPSMNNGFGYSTAKPTDQTKPGFNYDEWNKAGERLRDLFYTSKNKEAIARGIDRYADEVYIVYNPDRSAYWLLVKVKEVYSLLIDFWKLHPDKIQSEFMTKFLEDEYSNVSESDKDKYLDGTSIDGCISINTNVPVMRINPEYWNKNLPRSAIQIISFKCPVDKRIIENEMEEQLKNNDGTYHIGRFLREFDVNSLLSVIDK